MDLLSIQGFMISITGLILIIKREIKDRKNIKQEKVIANDS